jgi:hypothetical protein
MSVTQGLLNFGPWVLIKDGNPEAFELFKRHYSYRPYADGRRQRSNNPNRRLFVGPGFKTVLMTPDLKALFVWRKFIDDSGQNGVNCSVFRNEGPQRSSDLILAAEEHAEQRWPGERLYTYVNAAKVASSNPGYCFKCAGWKECGTTKSGKLILFKGPK